MHHSLVSVYRAQSYVNGVNKKRLVKPGGKEKAPGFGTWIFVVPEALTSFRDNQFIGLLKDGFVFSSDIGFELDC